MSQALRSSARRLGLRDASIPGLNVNISYFEVERANNITHPTTNVFDYFGTVKFRHCICANRVRSNISAKLRPKRWKRCRPLKLKSAMI